MELWENRKSIYFFPSPVILPVLQVFSISVLLIILNFITCSINCPFKTELVAGREPQTWSCLWRQPLCPLHNRFMSLPLTEGVAGLKLTPLVRQNLSKLVSTAHFLYYTLGKKNTSLQYPNRYNIHKLQLRVNTSLTTWIPLKTVRQNTKNCTLFSKLQMQTSTSFSAKPNTLNLQRRMDSIKGCSWGADSCVHFPYFSTAAADVQRQQPFCS